MIYTLDAIKPGATFPPDSESDRMEMYHNNKLLFEAKHDAVYEHQMKRVQRIIDDFRDIISYPVILNYQRLMSLKIADLLFGEPPKFKAGDPDSKEQATVDAIVAGSSLIYTGYQAAIDASRYGDGLFYVRKVGDRGIIDLTQPPIWYPVVSRDNVREITAHVLAWTYEDETPQGRQKYLKMMIHEKGYVTTRIYTMDGHTIMKQVGGDQRTGTEMHDFAVVQVSNMTPSDRPTGIDDYTQLDSIIAEMMVRVGQIARILDKHAAPSMTGPQSALERDPATGEWRLKNANYFPRGSAEDPAPEYITWEGNLDASFKALDQLNNQLYTISEMGPAIFGDLGTKTGQVPSGSALRRLMVSPLAKVNRIRMSMDAGLKKAIVLCSQLGGPGIVDLTNVPITITWQDGLPGDPVEESTIMQTRTANRATMSVRRALQMYDGMSEADSEKEYEQIIAEAEDETPVVTTRLDNQPPSAEPDAEE